MTFIPTPDNSIFPKGKRPGARRDCVRLEVVSDVKSVHAYSMKIHRAEKIARILKFIKY